MKITEVLISVLISLITQAFVWVVGIFLSENADQFIALMFVILSYIFGAILVPVLVEKRKIARKNQIINSATMFAGGLCVLLIFVNTSNGMSFFGLEIASAIVPVVTGANLLLAITMFCTGFGK